MHSNAFIQIKIHFFPAHTDVSGSYWGSVSCLSALWHVDRRRRSLSQQLCNYQPNVLLRLSYVRSSYAGCTGSMNNDYS